ncbi:hypothetical protein GLAREA_10608 [Glarea lozoyensis ATCC 20868]|uniref:Transcription factor domain-containing protein n=1 Tax=Glarea lozoyensis (strain ATCC 20868 / MF5171) TaxID=1116229 RepID=S3E9E2_GLAL2|nr:uncharacterized protein GLAREA_10608 [Glarea lozoyensis ATCC 20868]EPE34913.1 hypothetical protein GLAREA_10608 [Glarea lozoyensis ATCC 20868]
MAMSTRRQTECLGLTIHMVREGKREGKNQDNVFPLPVLNAREENKRNTQRQQTNLENANFQDARNVSIKAENEEHGFNSTRSLVLDPRLWDGSVVSGPATNFPEHERLTYPVLPSQPEEANAVEKYDYSHSTCPGFENLSSGFEYEDDEISGLFRVHSQNPYYQYDIHSNHPHNLVFNEKVGDVAVERLYSLPIEPTRRNAELFHFFLQKLAPFMSSIDGTDPPEKFMAQWIPFMIQSPMVVYLCILSAAYCQAAASGIDVEKSVDVVTTKVKLITMINEHITTSSRGVDDGAIAAVMSLAYNELVYSDTRSTNAHMTGVRDMLKCRGGIESIQVPVLRMMLMRTDLQIACTLECDPIVQGAQEPVEISRTFQSQFNSPFLLSKTTFQEFAAESEISEAGVKVLDDTRFITASMLSLGRAQDQNQARIKFQTTVQWIHDRLMADKEAAVSNDTMYQTCRAAALIFTSAILERKPLSAACTESLFLEVWKTMWRVPLSRWKQIPGVFLFVLLVVNPFTRSRPEGRLIKGMLAPSIIAIGFVDWEVVAAILTAFLGVQKWLGGNDEVSLFQENRLAVSRALHESQPQSDWALTR